MSVDGEITIYVAAGAASIGYIARTYAPVIIQSILKRQPKNGKSHFSREEHEKLCQPVKKSIEDFTSKVDSIHSEVRWLRALAVVQSSKESIEKANEITGV